MLCTLGVTSLITRCTSLLSTWIWLGLEKGRILRFADFRVRPVAQVLHELDEVLVDTLLQRGKEVIRQNHYNLKGSPALLASQQQYPHNILVPILFGGSVAAIHGGISQCSFWFQETSQVGSTGAKGLSDVAGQRAAPNQLIACRFLSYACSRC
jgi:hypothetical protein